MAFKIITTTLIGMVLSVLLVAAAYEIKDAERKTGLCVVTGLIIPYVMALICMWHG